MALLLEAEDLRVSFYTKEGEVKAVNGVGFTLEEESVLCLVGESGAGRAASEARSPLCRDEPSTAVTILHLPAPGVGFLSFI